MVVSFSLYRLLDGLRRRVTSATAPSISHGRETATERPALYPYF